jgi:hypothetical protein
MQNSPRAIPVVLLLAALVALGGSPHSLLAAGPTNATVELTLKGRRLEGLPIAWNDDEVHLLGRDGRLWAFNPADALNFKKTSTQFRSYSPSEFRAELLREMGPGYEVTGTSHYLIVHPSDQGDRWAERFEELYRSFVRYFSVRGFEPLTPQFPLVGAVCRNQAEFARRAELEEGKKDKSIESPAGLSLPNATAGGVQGYYDVDSNRISLYDMGAKTDSADWRKNAAVLIHEATHQTAFNTGIHSRYCPPPLWLAEGLAMQFETPGVHDSHNNSTLGDRINQERLKAFRQGVLPRHRPEMLAAIVATDDLFRINPGVAYAEAWAMSFFFSETEPHKYVEYLKRTAARPPFEEYTASERTADFVAVFGKDWRMLEARLLRFIAGLR